MEHTRKPPTRGVNASQQRLWAYLIEKEDKLRLTWFKKNEARLEHIANKENTRKVADELKEDMKDKMMNYFQNLKKHVTPSQNEVFDAPILIDEDAIYNTMKPVEKATRDLIYSSTLNDGRLNYLKERYKLIPEQRYYFPETTSFQYGWNMWDHPKLNATTRRFSRQQVIKDSFYRRRGVDRDPDWYKEPAQLSPNVCGCI